MLYNAEHEVNILVNSVRTCTQSMPNVKYFT